MEKLKLGFCMTGSFCTFRSVIDQMKLLSEQYSIVPIMSYHAYTLDTRFGTAREFIDEIESICQHKIIATIPQAEPVGPKQMTDLMLVAPCTGNTLAKLAMSITDTPATMAVKSHLRNSKPVVIAVSTNDSLSGSAKNIGALMNLKHYYFVPYRQDNYKTKPTSMVADFSLIPQTLEAALNKRQIQPVILS
jgi:dipicolinate synthase subunit B